MGTLHCILFYFTLFFFPLTSGNESRLTATDSELRPSVGPSFHLPQLQPAPQEIDGDGEGV